MSDLFFRSLESNLKKLYFRFDNFEPVPSLTPSRIKLEWSICLAIKKARVEMYLWLMAPIKVYFFFMLNSISNFQPNWLSSHQVWLGTRAVAMAFYQRLQLLSDLVTAGFISRLKKLKIMDHGCSTAVEHPPCNLEFWVRIMSCASYSYCLSLPTFLHQWIVLN